MFFIASREDNTRHPVPKCRSDKAIVRNYFMSQPHVWATKVAALIQGGNSAAALAQIKVAPAVKDLHQLRAILTSAKLVTRNPNVDAAIQDMIMALSSPRLHRSP
jgi:hypothetical protein